MPKKRHQNKYSKPPSVAPPSLSISSSSRTNSGHHERSVNEILATMRRTSLNSNSNSNAANNSHVLEPSVPPVLRQILQIPDTPAPPPRRPQRFRLDANGRRAPPGPLPPRSWITLPQFPHAPRELGNTGRIQHWPLPGAYCPEDGSFIDLILRRMAQDWSTQKEWNRFYLYTMPSKLRLSLLHHVSLLYEPGLWVDDLKLVLEGPPESELAQYGIERPNLETLNSDMYHLDLAGSTGKSLTLKALGELLFPTKTAAEVGLQDSWDMYEPSYGPTLLLPQLRQLCLAISPGSYQSPSWRQLLSLSTKLSTLTHLNLSGWSTPSLTPNAIAAKVVLQTTGRVIDYGGTNPYSHTLDDDWSEAVLVLKKLSRALYGLEYLDITSCGDWFPALRKDVETDQSAKTYIDWTSDWGKITMLRLTSGYVADPDSKPQLERLWEWKREAAAVERHIIAQRAGRGRFITVETDSLPETELF